MLQTFANDPDTDFCEWVANPSVLGMLRSALELIERGAVTDQQLQHYLLQQLKDPANAHHAEFAEKSSTKVKLAAEQLVAALNEHVSCTNCFSEKCEWIHTRRLQRYWKIIRVGR